ncbi:MAG TPA: 2-C-methyl-D-erythritol 4-phosphate cytidylyltransferase [Coriobacteriia bacterium]|nr:2-C-methyl-D-erythritol 4-phosphate cytidylyltransferase [Coriobacteriia bacterium]
MKTGMIVLAGGVGKRMGQPIPKQFIMMGGKPIIAHVLEKAERLADVEKVVITCPGEYVAETNDLLRHRNLSGRFCCIEGGETRQDSVYNGLMALDGFDRVIVHEAVRPFVTYEEFRALIDSEFDNAIYGTRIPFTVVAGHDYVEGTFERSELVNVQLPQKFDRAKLVQAHEMARAEGARQFTEDASLLFHYLKEPVRILEGSERNIKITEPTDLIIGEAIYGEYVLGRAQD